MRKCRRVVERGEDREKNLISGDKTYLRFLRKEIRHIVRGRCEGKGQTGGAGGVAILAAGGAGERRGRVSLRGPGALGGEYCQSSTPSPRPQRAGVGPRPSHCLIPVNPVPLLQATPMCKQPPTISNPLGIFYPTRTYKQPQELSTSISKPAKEFLRCSADNHR